MNFGNVDSVQIESDERGFELHLSTDEFGPIVVNIQSECETLYDQVKARIGPYLQERDEVKRVFECNPSYEEFMRSEYDHERMTGQHAGEFSIDDGSGYDRSDPKHPNWHSVHADIWDNRDKTAGV